MTNTKETTMTTISLTDIIPENESTAVAAGKMVLAAMPADGRLMIEDDDLAEDVFGEMKAYLSRRGVRVHYDHDAGYPIASRS